MYVCRSPYQPLCDATIVFYGCNTDIKQQQTTTMTKKNFNVCIVADKVNHSCIHLAFYMDIMFAMNLMMHKLMKLVQKMVHSLIKTVLIQKRCNYILSCLSNLIQKKNIIKNVVQIQKWNKYLHFYWPGAHICSIFENLFPIEENPLNDFIYDDVVSSK